MSTRITLVTALLAAGAVSTSYAADPNWRDPSEVFDNIHGSASLDSADGHQNQLYGPSAVYSGDSVGLSDLVVTECVPSKFSCTPLGQVTLTVSSASFGGLSVNSFYSSPTAIPTTFSLTATWTGTLTNSFAESRNFELGFANRLTAPTSVADDVAFQLTVNGATTAESSPGDYDIGTLASGASKTVSMTMTLNETTADSIDAQTTLIGYASSPVSPVPEPSTAMLFAAGFAAFGVLGRRRKLAVDGAAALAP